MPDIISRALAALQAEFKGGTVRLAKSRVDLTETILIVHIATMSVKQKEQAEQKAWNTFAAYHPGKLKPDYLGKTFIMQGRYYTITGCQPSKPKYSVLATRDDGKVFGFPIDNVAQHMNAMAALKDEEDDL